MKMAFSPTVVNNGTRGKQRYCFDRFIPTRPFGWDRVVQPKFMIAQGGEVVFLLLLAVEPVQIVYPTICFKTSVNGLNAPFYRSYLAYSSLSYAPRSVQTPRAVEGVD